jgi:ribonuclease BN (tRNA processing enzyme)
MVHHSDRLRSYGYRLTRGGRAIAFSGDTGAVEPVSDLAKDSDVLIVECTNLDWNRGDHFGVRDVAQRRGGSRPRPGSG